MDATYARQWDLEMSGKIDKQSGNGEINEGYDKGYPEAA